MKEITTQQLHIMRIEIDRVFRNDVDNLHPKILYQLIKDNLKLEYENFFQMLSACIETGRIVGYKIGHDGTLYRDELQEQLQEKKEAAHRQAQAKKTRPPPITIRVMGKCYDVPMTIIDIKTLLFSVLEAEEVEDVPIERCVELEGKRYDCDAEVFGRFVSIFFGASLGQEKQGQ